jgi:hypothetical protein
MKWIQEENEWQQNISEKVTRIQSSSDNQVQLASQHTTGG